MYTFNNIIFVMMLIIVLFAFICMGVEIIKSKYDLSAIICFALLDLAICIFLILVIIKGLLILGGAL